MKWDAPEAIEPRQRRLGQRFLVGEKIWHLIAVHKSHPRRQGASLSNPPKSLASYKTLASKAPWFGEPGP
jgi:hypothetical protein